MVRAIVFAIMAIGFWSSIVSADTVYVDPAGTNSGDGAIANPWKTLEYACNNTATGNVIKLNPGTFTETAQCRPKAGVSIIGSGRTGANKTVVLAGWSSTGNFSNDGHLIRVEVDIGAFESQTATSIRLKPVVRQQRSRPISRLIVAGDYRGTPSAWYQLSGRTVQSSARMGRVPSLAAVGKVSWVEVP